MLATEVKSFSDGQIKKHLTGEWFYEVKLDGMRCVATVTPTSVKCESRNGKPMAFAEQYFADEFARIQKKMGSHRTESLLFDGELYSKDWNTSMALTPNRVKALDPSIKVSFVVFDVIADEDYSLDYATRRVQLEYWLHNPAGKGGEYGERNDIHAIECHKLQTTPDFQPEDILMALKVKAEALITQGYEGLIAKRDGHLYQIRQSESNGKFRSVRSREWIKFKDVTSEDLEVIDTVESEINPGTVGTVVVQFGDETVKVGGLTIEQKTDYFKDPSIIVGKVIEVKHYGVTSNKKLRHPTMVTVREDKDVTEVRESTN